MTTDRKLWAFLACRNQGSRLWGKPLQNISIADSITILDYLIHGIKQQKMVSGIALAISQGVENEVFKGVADRHGIPYVVGSEKDVLGRLVQCFEISPATDVLRVTTESPFPAFEYLEQAWTLHQESGAAMTTLDNVPDGCGFEIITKNALVQSHRQGDERHRSELCSLYIREHKDKLLVQNLVPTRTDLRTDLRLTVDYPEDLIVARAVFDSLAKKGKIHPSLSAIVAFLDGHPDLRHLVDQFVPAGMKSMYV